MPSPYTLWAALLALSAGASALHQNREADVFFHLELGRAVLAERARTVTEPYALPGFEPTCMAPAWLWDVLAYALHAIAGFPGLGLFCVLSAVLAALGCARFTFVAGRDSQSRFAAWAVVSAACAICIAPRFQVRPQTLALAVLAVYLVLAYRHVRAESGKRLASGALLVCCALVWAQLHGSFVLAPVLFVIIAAGRSLETWRAPSAPRVDLLVLAGTTVALATSPAGLGVFAYIGSHGYGDAVRFIYEMRPPQWVDLVALNGTSGKALVLLWLLCLFGATREGRWQWTALGLALLGHVLLSRAVRFVAEDAVLCAPLALTGAANLAEWARRAFAARSLPALTGALLLLAAAGLGQSALDNRGGYGARFGLGNDETAFPRLAARYLARMPRGTPVLSSFLAGPALGFWSGARLRTYVDGRTPLYFDDADYALEREVLTNADALDRALNRYGFRAAVVERDHGVCDLLTKRGWQPVVIEATYSTFVPGGGDAALEGIDPCGPVYIHTARAARNLPALDRSLARLAKLGPTPFLDLLRAERLLLDPSPDAERALSLLERSAAPSYARPHLRARVSALLAHHDASGAYQVIRDGLRAGDGSLAAFVVRPELATLSGDQLRELLELTVSTLGEGAAPPLRSLLAAICREQGDAECARFHVLRAAARAAPNVEPTLLWLTQHADSERKRADARAWLDLLQRERTAAAADTVTP
ncbi:MAG TPA: hypothetical protein VJV78_41325 [Polyangiales bacterium]|nr:hypothetical protein [Polyangiales bacterium]